MTGRSRTCAAVVLGSGSSKYARLTMPRLGQAALGLASLKKRVKLGVYLVAWRHANAILTVVYVGCPSYPTGSLIEIARHSESRMP